MNEDKYKDLLKKQITTLEKELDEYKQELEKTELKEYKSGIQENTQKILLNE